MFICYVTRTQIKTQSTLLVYIDTLLEPAIEIYKQIQRSHKFYGPYSNVIAM